MLTGLEGLVPADKVAALRTSTNSPVSHVAPVTQTAAPATTAAPVAPVTQTVPTINPIVVKSPLGEFTYGGAPIADVKLETFQDVQKFAKEYAGVELKEVKDFAPFFTQVKTLQEQAAQAAELQKVVDNYKSNLEALPKEVVQILDAAVTNGDYQSVITNLQKKSAVDYTKPFSGQDPVALANMYTGKTYTKETFEALEETSRSALTDSIKMKFDADRDSVLNFESNNKITMDKKQKEFSTSIDTSIAAFAASNPRVDKSALAEVKKVMQFGLSDVLFDKNRNYAPDAAEKVAMMLYGKQTIDSQSQAIGDLVKKSVNESVTGEIQKILNRSDKPPVQTGAPASNVIAQQVAEATSWLPKRK
jgi:hypothetical protein